MHEDSTTAGSPSGGGGEAMATASSTSHQHQLSSSFSGITIPDTEQVELSIGPISASGGGSSMDTSAPAATGGYSGPHAQTNPGQPSGPPQMLVSGAGASVDYPDSKDLIEELCPVCGDKVSGYHYGLLTCESCKGFFKRTVQNKKVYTCVAERSCHIDKTQRKRCPYCRFQKCLEVGMKLEAVRADRMRGGRNKFGPMYKRDRARKLQMMRQRQMQGHSNMRSGNNASGSSASSQLDTLSAYPPVAAAVAAAAAAVGGTPGVGHFPNIHIKQEIQIPQVSSLTHSPDSSPSPITVALGQAPSGGNNNVVTPVTSHHQPVALAGASGLQGVSGAGGAGGSGSNPSGGVGADGNPGDHKMWSANSTTPSPHSLSPKAFHFDAPANANPPSAPTKIPRMIREFVQQVDDREWQNSLYSLLQNQTYNQCEVDLFELMCKVLDQNLFSQVDWARNSSFFKDLKVDDQMKLLQHSWSDMLVLDHLHQRMHNALPDEMNLPNGQKFDLLALGLLGVPTLSDHFNALTARLHDLKFDLGDYVCLKFLLLLNPEVRGILNRKHVQEGFEQVQHALHEYTITCCPHVPDKFNKLLLVMPDIHMIATRGEDHLYAKHCNGGAPTQTLLMEMLHAKRK